MDYFHCTVQQRFYLFVFALFSRGRTTNQTHPRDVADRNSAIQEIAQGLEELKLLSLALNGAVEVQDAGCGNLARKMEEAREKAQDGCEILREAEKNDVVAQTQEYIRSLVKTYVTEPVNVVKREAADAGKLWAGNVASASAARVLPIAIHEGGSTSLANLFQQTASCDQFAKTVFGNAQSGFRVGGQLFGCVGGAVIDLGAGLYQASNKTEKVTACKGAGGTLAGSIVGTGAMAFGLTGWPVTVSVVACSFLGKKAVLYYLDD
mmetsp:Transcript_29801/g.72208  ORF Transcript_29801/g.72208 Transcript_29801/m.72208 type:complete len:264 (+) Transcript_29801:572-1363(+)